MLVSHRDVRSQASLRPVEPVDGDGVAAVVAGGPVDEQEVVFRPLPRLDRVLLKRARVYMDAFQPCQCNNKGTQRQLWLLRDIRFQFAYSVLFQSERYGNQNIS